jgi:hypothetical protein
VINFAPTFPVQVSGSKFKLKIKSRGEHPVTKVIVSFAPVDEDPPLPLLFPSKDNPPLPLLAWLVETPTNAHAAANAAAAEMYFSVDFVFLVSSTSSTFVPIKGTCSASDCILRALIPMQFLRSFRGLLNPE